MDSYRFIIVMGVTGSGKTTVGSLLGRELGWQFFDADDFHSATNKDKMRRGEPLTDQDRAPWLEALGALAKDRLARRLNGVLACSALKDNYRKIICGGDPRVRFVYLAAGEELIEKRLGERKGHFMNPGLVGSQFAALEEPSDAFVIDAGQDPDAIVDEIRRELLTSAA